MDESDESESYDPILPDDLPRPKRTVEPPPLQRLWKSPPEPEEVDELEAAKAKKNKPAPVEEPPPKKKVKVSKPLFIKKKKPEPVIDDGTGVTKLEETPVLDTYEARQRARWLVGGLGVLIFFIFGSMFLSWVKGGGNDEIRDGEPPDPRSIAGNTSNSTSASNTPSDVESEARIMLDNAKQADKLGKVKAAVNLLNRLFKAYPNTAAGREAQAAIEHYRQNKPLFGGDTPQLAGDTLKAPATGPKIATGPTPPNSPTSPTSPSIASNAKPGPDVKKPPDGPSNVQTSITPPGPTIAIKPLPVGYRPNYDFPIHPSGWPTRIRADQDGGELVLVPGGIFDMGREDGEVQEAPVHRVGMSPYYIDLHEVTVHQYAIFLKSSGRSLEAIKKSAVKGVDPAKLDDYPMVNVSFKEAKAFCEWAKRSLPTEAQWELAARSTEGRISYWNEQLPRPDPAKGTRVMEPVMSLPTDVSAYGAFDLGANAWEWTSEFYDSQYYKSSQFRNVVNDPPGPKESKTKIFSITVKGGSKSGILTWREGKKPESREPYLGFRGALTIVAPATTANGPGTAPPTTRPPLTGGVQPF
jgi:sulfatase modifying factor 1